MGHRRSLIWLRRDLRIADNTAVHAAFSESDTCVFAFVVNPELLASEHIGAPIVTFFFHALTGLRSRLRELGSDLVLLEGDFREQLLSLSDTLRIDALHYNKDVDPRVAARDEAVTAAFLKSGRTVSAHIDVTLLDADAVLKPDRKPYTVFTPFKRRYLERIASDPRPPFPEPSALRKKLLKLDELPASRALPKPEDFGYTVLPGFLRGDEQSAKLALAAFIERRIAAYGEQRNFPAIDGTSILSPHLRAGTIGIRTCFDAAFRKRHEARGTDRDNIDIWISELVWREFYQQILTHFPYVVDGPFDPRGKNIEWDPSDDAFSAWCEGRTGFPIVDAAMRSLNETGYMHNRLRMITASFLTKDLLIDWRRGELYFEQHLADAEVASNNGGWQWTASTGTDSAPYFRIFNPTTQSEKFDPDGGFIRSMIPELAGVSKAYIHEPAKMPPMLARAAGVEIGNSYPTPIVDHSKARERTLAAYTPTFGKRTD